MSEHPENEPLIPDDQTPDAPEPVDAPNLPEPVDRGSEPEIVEPPVVLEDTQPQRPLVTPMFGPLPPPGEPPFDDDDTPPRPMRPPQEPAGTPARSLLTLLVMVMMLCICITSVGLAGFAGYRDGLATSAAKSTHAVATEIAVQYAAGVENMDAGLYELAIARFEWIVETVRPPARYLSDSVARLSIARTAAAVTPTPSAAPTEASTPTPTITPEPTRTPVPAPATEATPAPDMSNPAYLYEEAARASRLGRYEEAIEWLRSLQALDSNHRPQETHAMLMEALTLQGRIYLRGANEDGEDQLARGVLLIYEASELGTVEPQSLLYEADVAERYLNARNYLNGGNYAQAAAILEQLCAEAESTCNWSYRGVSVRDLLERARAGGPAPGAANGS